MLVKKITRPDGKNAVALWQTITDSGIDQPKVIVTGPRKSPSWNKLTALIDICRLKEQTQSRRMEKSQPEGNPVGCYVLEKECYRRVILKPLTLIFRAESQPWMGCPEEVSAPQILATIPASNCIFD